VGTIVASSAFCGYAAFRWPYQPLRAAQDLGADSPTLGPLELRERSGRTVTSVDLGDRVAIASFIFTSCPLSCPRITSIMQGLQGRLSATDVLLVSFSVDPERDTPEVLSKYAQRYGASPDRWWFLTGPKSAIYDLILDRFRLPITAATGPVAEGTEPIQHSERLVLIDRGRIVGYFDSHDASAIDSLVSKATRLSLPAWVTRLPTLNATLNGLSAGLLFAGWLLIRRYRRVEVRVHSSPTDEPGAELPPWPHPLVRGHIFCMISAVAASAVFLGCYLYYHYKAGSTSFSQGGPLRVAYLSILLSHTLLATISVPLILVTIRRGWFDQRPRHVTLGSLTLPIWLYVGVTGVVIYLMLYHLPAFAATVSSLP
jgi:protein SCO1/2/putative membrane protein